MYPALISLLLVSFCSIIHSAEAQPASQTEELEIIIVELDLTLDNFFALIDDQDLDIFIAGVRHAARARLLLEQLLGEQIDNLNYYTANTSEEEYQLRQIAKRAQELSGNAGRELWRQDHDDKQWALLRLSELENMVKHLKRRVYG